MYRYTGALHSQYSTRKGESQVTDTIEAHEAKHHGLPPVMFARCPRCNRPNSWDIRRKRCISCEWHYPTSTPPATSPSPRERVWTFVAEPEPVVREKASYMVVVTVQIPAHTRGTDTYNRFCADLLAAYGGFSQTDVRGVWRNDNGRTVQEGMVRFEIAMSAGEAATFRLHKVPLICKMFRQDAIYHTMGGTAWIT